MQNSKYNVVSLFSGCGGSSLGYKLAGMKVLLANEFIPAACDTYEANFKDTILLRDDIRTIKGKDILNKIKLNVGELDVLDGSPPCAAFSSVGSREKKWGQVVKYSDTKQRVDDLFFEYTRMIEEMKPKVFIAENVQGLVTGKVINVFDEIIAEMRSKGYKVKARLLNAKYFNVPQNRPRLIFIGVRNDLNIEPSHPLPENRIITLKQAIKDVKNEEWELQASKYKENYSVYKLLQKMKPGESGCDYTNGTSYFSLKRLDWDKVCTTVLQSDAKQTSSSLVHPEEYRRLTITELKRVSSFPEDFVLTGTYQQQWERIGRAVPPNMMKAIAEHVRYFILDKINNIKTDKLFPYYDLFKDEESNLTYNEIELLQRKNPFNEYGIITNSKQIKLF